MTYQKQFKPGPDFAWAVSPFLADLAALVGEKSLTISCSESRGNSLKWQWANYLHHFFEGRYKISLRKAQGKAFLTISLRSALAVKLEAPTNANVSVVEELSDDELDEKLRKIISTL